MAATKLIFACDTSNFEKGCEWIDEVAPEVDMVKVGLEAQNIEDGFGETYARGFRIRARDRGKKSMADFKFLDIGNTVGGAARNIAKRGYYKFFTLHAQASDAALEAAAEACQGTDTIALAVTVLTDLDDRQVWNRFQCGSAAMAVEKFAFIAYNRGIRGFVCSGQEVQVIRQQFSDVIIVTPDIRPLWWVGEDEQKRGTTPTFAAQAGADYIVVGRPISQPPLGYTSLKAAKEVNAELLAA